MLMVLPSEETLRNELTKLPIGKLTTIPMLHESIANKIGVTTACPKTSLKMLRNMMEKKKHRCLQSIKWQRRTCRF